MNPPVTSAVRGAGAPHRRHQAARARASGGSARPPVRARLRSVPASKATRASSASAKSISPFIARRVISATRGPMPRITASSSSISFSMIVDSRSATSSRLRRPAAGWTTISTAAPPTISRAVAVDRRRVRSIEDQIAGLPRREPDRAGPDRQSGSRSRRRGREGREPAAAGDQGEDDAHARSSYALPPAGDKRLAGEAGAHAGGRHRRPDRERQIGAGLGAGRRPWAAPSSMPTACNAIATCRS